MTVLLLYLRYILCAKKKPSVEFCSSPFKAEEKGWVKKTPFSVVFSLAFWHRAQCGMSCCSWARKEEEEEESKIAHLSPLFSI